MLKQKYIDPIERGREKQGEWEGEGGRNKPDANLKGKRLLQSLSRGLEEKKIEVCDSFKEKVDLYFASTHQPFLQLSNSINKSNLTPGLVFLTAKIAYVALG